MTHNKSAGLNGLLKVSLSAAMACPAQRHRNVLRFWRKSTRESKNVCDAVVAHFLR